MFHFDQLVNIEHFHPKQMYVNQLCDVLIFCESDVQLVWKISQPCKMTILGYWLDSGALWGYATICIGYICGQSQCCGLGNRTPEIWSYCQGTDRVSYWNSKNNNLIYTVMQVFEASISLACLRLRLQVAFLHSL